MLFYERGKMKKIIKFILLAICLCIFIFSAYNIYKYLVEENANKKLNNTLIEKAIIKTTNDSKNTTQDNKDLLPISVNFSILKKENEEIIGWIYLNDSPINYPVVQTDDNNYYLSRLINREYNIAGSIFMDYRNSPKLENNNTILYGHNMNNNTMFGSLKKYKTQEFYDNHKVMYYFTPEKNYIIEIFTGYTISVESDIYDLSILDNDKLKELISNSDFKSNVEVKADDKIITLSTCAYEYDGARYIIMGVLHEI